MNPTTPFDRVIDRSQSRSVKWSRYGSDDVIPMWVADMDFAAPPPVLDAIRRRLEHPVLGYTLPPTDLAEVVADAIRRRHRWDIAPEALVWLPNLVSGLHVCCRMLPDPTDAVITHTPIYPPFLSAPLLSNRPRLDVPLRDCGTHFESDVAAFRRAAGPNAALFLLCNPHNPTGRVFARDELSALADVCLEKDLLICDDAIHCDLLLQPDRRYLPFAALGHDLAARTITLMSAAKTCNLPGLNCGFAIIPDSALRARFRRTMQDIVPHVNIFGYAACRAAYRDCDGWIADLIAYLRGNRALVIDRLTGLPGVRLVAGEATYLAWIDCREMGQPDPTSHFAAHGLGLHDGAEFGAPGWVRLNFGCPRALLAKALQRFRRAVAAAPQ